eukprot:tig00000042_g15575.t1
MGREWLSEFRAYRKRLEFSIFRIAYLAFSEGGSDSLEKKWLVIFESIQFTLFPMLVMLTDLKGFMARFVFGFGFTEWLGAYLPLALLSAFLFHCHTILQHFKRGVPVEDSFWLVWSFRTVWRTLKPLIAVAVKHQALRKVAYCSTRIESFTGFGAIFCAVDYVSAVGVTLCILLLSILDYSPSLDGPSLRNRAWSGAIMQETSRVCFVLISCFELEMSIPTRQLLCVPILITLAVHEVMCLTEPVMWFCQVRVSSYLGGVLVVLVSLLSSFEIISSSSVPWGVLLLLPFVAWASFVIAQRHFERVSKDPSTLIQHLSKLSPSALWFPYRYRYAGPALTPPQYLTSFASTFALARIRSFWESLLRNDLDPHVLAKVPPAPPRPAPPRPAPTASPASPAPPLPAPAPPLDPRGAPRPIR